MAKKHKKSRVKKSKQKTKSSPRRRRVRQKIYASDLGEQQERRQTYERLGQRGPGTY